MVVQPEEPAQRVLRVSQNQKLEENRSQSYLSWMHAMMFRINNCADGVHRFVQMKFSIYNHIVESFHTVKFLGGNNQSKGPRGGLFPPAPFQTMHQILF